LGVLTQPLRGQYGPVILKEPLVLNLGKHHVAP
jgi:hypothetical protein